MKLEFLLQFIMPLTFLAIWALTSLLNRDAQPLPPRPGAGRGPGIGPARTGPAGASRRPAGRPDGGRAGHGRGSPGVPDAGTARAGAMVHGDRAGTAGSGPSRDRAADEGIVILESETRSPQIVVVLSVVGGFQPRATRGTAPATRRAASRGRSTSAPPIKPIEPERPRDPDRPGRSVHGPEAVQAARDHSALDADVAPRRRP